MARSHSLGMHTQLHAGCLIMKKSGSCQVVMAHFAWFSQTCGEPATRQVVYDSVRWWVCDEHITDLELTSSVAN